MSRLNTRLRGGIDRIQDALAEMSPRDRSLLLGLIGGAILLVVGGSLWWMNATISSMETRLADRQETLRLIELMAEDQASGIVKAEAIREQLKLHQDTKFSSFIEQTASKAQVQDNLKTVREKSTSTDGELEEALYAVELSKLTVEQFVAFLYETEAAGYPLKVRTLQVKTKTTKGETLLDVDLDVSAFRVIEDDTEESSG